MGYDMNDNNYFNWSYSNGGIFYNNNQKMKLINPYSLKKRIKKGR